MLRALSSLMKSMRSASPRRGLGGGHDEREQTLNRCLLKWTALETNEGVILIAATNRPDVLDPALLVRDALTAASSFRDRIRRAVKQSWACTPQNSHGPRCRCQADRSGTPGFSGDDLANWSTRRRSSQRD